MKNFISKYLPETIGGALCLGLSLLWAHIIQVGDSLWYASLTKPSFSPPEGVFIPISAVFYAMMGIVLGRLWKNKSDHSLLLWVFLFQFMFNFLWATLFFYFERVDLALYDMGLLYFNLVVFMLLARQDSMIIGLCLPYAIWMGFVFLLNVSIYILNLGA